MFWGGSEYFKCGCDKQSTYFDGEGKPRCEKCDERARLAR